MRLTSIRIIDLLVLGAIAGGAGAAWFMNRGSAASPEDSNAFAQQVDLGPFDSLAVQADGRLRSFESHAKTYLGYVVGPRRIRGQSNAFTYLDLIFKPEKNRDVDLIYVKNKQVRAQIVDTLRNHGGLTAERADRIRRTGLFSTTLLATPPVPELLQRLGQDLIRTAKVVDAISSALSVASPRFLMENLRLVPPPGGEVDKPWFSVADLVGADGTPGDEVHAGLSPGDRSVSGLSQGVQDQVRRNWSKLRESWRAENVAEVNTAITELAKAFPGVAPALYPSQGRLRMESWYFRNQGMTWVWLVYLGSVVPLLMSAIYGWNGAHRAGMILFVVGFALQTASLAVRWYISGRWPNSNMFEAVTTSAWMGGVAALVFEGLLRRTALRAIFALASAIMSMLALMVAYFLPAQLDSTINNKMAALNDVWLYIHTNMIIWSYAIIGLACVPALLYLRHRWCGLWDRRSVSRPRLVLLPIALGVLNYTGYRLLMHVLNDPARELSRSGFIGMSGALVGAFLVVLNELMAARARREAGLTHDAPARGGAAALVIPPSTPAHSFLRRPGPTAPQVFDAATMLLVELAFIMLWTGIVMGAIWADHSWGRPWGWDPKEVFALNTFFIFLVLIHVRLKVRDKGFWTAVIAIAGFEVMMFNWIVVNFVISGLHSYA